MLRAFRNDTGRTPAPAKAVRADSFGRPSVGQKNSLHDLASYNDEQSG